MAQLHQFLLKSVFDADLVKIGAAMSQMLYYMFICYWLLLSITLTFEAESRFDFFFKFSTSSPNRIFLTIHTCISQVSELGKVREQRRMKVLVGLLIIYKIILQLKKVKKK